MNFPLDEALDEGCEHEKKAPSRDGSTAHALFASLRAPLLLLDGNLRIQRANPAFEAVVGNTSESYRGQKMSEFLGGALYTDELAVALRHLQADHRPFTGCEVSGRLPGLGPRLLIWHGSVLHDPAGSSATILLELEDLTERRHTERSLADKARLLDLTTDAIIVRDARHRICFWNQGAVKHFGFTSAEAVGRDLHSLLKTEFEQRLEDIIDQLHRTGEFRGEVVLTARDGRRLTMLCRGVFDVEKRNILTSYTDIGERKVAEKLMREALDQTTAAMKAKTAFLANLSHELRTPLTPVLLLASEAAIDPALPAPSREIFATVMRNVKVAARLIDDLLDTTRINHGKMTITREVVDVHPILRDAIEIVQEDLSRKKLVLKTRLTAPQSHVRGDAIRLQQVFWNVLRNAAKFTPAGGEIAAETAVSSEGDLEITISDSGIGMTPEQLARAFERFAQAGDAPANQGHGGLGLGLPITRALIELHGGCIRVESAGLNKGSTVTLTLPGAHAAAESVPPPGRQASLGKALPDARPRLRRVLLVEDHEPTRKVLTQLLASRRYDVFSVGSVGEGRDAMANRAFDLLISDIGLPDGSGNELMLEFRQRFGAAGIALTGYGYEEDAALSRASGFITHLTKPVSIETLERGLDLVQMAGQQALARRG